MNKYLNSQKYAEKETNSKPIMFHGSINPQPEYHALKSRAQIPFSSLNYGTDTSPEGRMAIKNLLLLPRWVRKGETPIFPIQIFKVKEGINYNPEDPNYDLLELACR